MINKILNRDVKCIIIGSSFFNIFLILFFIILFFLNKIIKTVFINIIIGIIIGYIFGIVYIIFMYKSLKEFMFFKNEKQAVSFIKKKNTFRYLFFVVFSFVLCFINKYIGLMTVVSMFGIKIGAYLTPIFRNFINE